ncbi:hypothetical protein [Sulfitobacter sp. B30-2]|uniref:hypothetical protein n=1 Tax=Sulfitobacter sp. B30-2 TaxID=2785912 RepID=UPI0018CDDD23|nr:hypothetical protein [Sulfitobacter sp. B30-2]QPO08264.1 hypothetical protein IT972_12075 [Sulfitobacter sp. B30-2]
MNALPAGSPIVIYVNGSPYGDTVTVEGSQTSGPSSGARAGYDAYQVHRDFPARWQAYIVANYRNIGHVTTVFGVSERTARNWWKGQFGANGGHVAVAMREHGQIAFQMLFAEAS